MAKQRTLDVEKVTEALKRAARAAVTGNREDRNGQFAPTGAMKTPTSADKKLSGKKK